MSKPLMYLLAGNGSAADWWDDALPHFQRYEVVPLELPGFGANPLPPCEDLADYAQTLLAMTQRGSGKWGQTTVLVITRKRGLSPFFYHSASCSRVGGRDT